MVGTANTLNLTQQGVPYFDGISVFTGLDGGTSGNVLTSNGTGVAPSFQTLSAVTSVTATNAGSTVAFTPTAGVYDLTLSDNFLNTVLGQSAIADPSSFYNTIVGANAGNTFVGNQNCFFGVQNINQPGTGSSNNIFGRWTHLNNVAFTMNDCCFLGTNAGGQFDSLANSILIGTNAGGSLTSSTDNIMIGYGSGVGSGQGITTGAYNVLIGSNTGASYRSTESNNILLGYNVTGILGESNVIRIGSTQTANYQAGISGVTVTGTAVLCATDGKLGTVASSIRYKENVIDMKDSVTILDLRPVEFNYISDNKKTKQYGLIAEEIDKDFPYLCFYNDQGTPESVKYHELPVLLLKEIQKINQRVTKLETKSD